MAKIKYDVSGSDPEEATTVRSMESPRPGRYVANIIEINEKGAGGDPDKPMLEVVYEVVDAEKEANQKYIGARLWYYVLLPGHPSYEGFPEQKMDQWLQANGIATKKKRKGSFDPDDLIDVSNVVIVRAGQNNAGEYRGEVANVLAFDEDEWESGSDESDGDEDEYDEPEDADEDEDEDADEDESEEDEDDEDEEEPEGDTEGEYDDLSPAELRTELDARGLSTRGSKAKLIERLEEDDASGEAAGDDDEGEEEDEEEEPPKSTAKKPTAKRSGGRGRSARGGAKKSAAKRGAAKRGGKAGRGKGSRSDFPFE